MSGATTPMTAAAMSRITDPSASTFLDDGLAQGARPGDRAERPVSISGGASGSFVYDAHGRRVKQVVGGQTIYSVYSASGTLLYRDNAATSTATDYIRMGGRAIARVRGSDVEWTHADLLGSPAAATSAAGAVLWREDHTPFVRRASPPPAMRTMRGSQGISPMRPRAWSTCRRDTTTRWWGGS